SWRKCAGPRVFLPQCRQTRTLNAPPLRFLAVPILPPKRIEDMNLLIRVSGVVEADHHRRAHHGDGRLGLVTRRGAGAACTAVDPQLGGEAEGGRGGSRRGSSRRARCRPNCAKTLRAFSGPARPSSDPPPFLLHQNPRTGLFPCFSACRRTCPCPLRHLAPRSSAR